MREPSGRVWAVCEASPSKKEQPLTFVPRAPSRFFSIYSLLEDYASNVRVAFFETTAPACTSGNSQSFLSAQIQAILSHRLVQ